MPQIKAAFDIPLYSDPMPIQDAIDLAEFLAQTAIGFSRFRAGSPTVDENDFPRPLRRGGCSAGWQQKSQDEHERQAMHVASPSACAGGVSDSGPATKGDRLFCLEPQWGGRQ
jgi:hypothetical protein